MSIPIGQIVPNPEQQACIDAIDGNYVVIAGAGTGKTSVLVKRDKQMMYQGIPDEDRLNLTFTSTAAENMSVRSGLLDGKKIFRTFHSYALEILRKEKEHLPFELSDEVIPVGLQEYELLFDLIRLYPMIENFRKLREKIGLWKNQGVTPGQALEEAINDEYFYALAYDDYEKKCRERGWLDFSSIIDECIQLLEINKEVRDRWKRKYISVDEYQDTDKKQVRLLKLLYGGHILAVGDESQCIFAWRSAHPDNLTKFEEDFPGAKKLFIGQNYRSTKRLVAFHKQILPVNNGLSEFIKTDNEEGVDPVIIRYSDPQEEAYFVLAKIDDPVNTAIIARTNRQLFEFQRICTLRNIKYKILGKTDFWEQSEIKRLLKLGKESNSQLPAVDVLTNIVEEYDLIKEYSSIQSYDSNPVENINNVVKMAAGKGNIREFLDYLRKLTYGRKSSKGLVMGTVHSCKGLEFRNVFFIGAQQGKVPHDDGETTEEKRILYVGVTRASHYLQISYSGELSQFLQDFKEQVIDLSVPVEEEVE